MRYRLEKKSNRPRKNKLLTNKADIEKRNKSLMAKCSRIIITAKKETTVKTLWKEKSKTIIAESLNCNYSNKVGRYCKQRN